MSDSPAPAAPPPSSPFVHLHVHTTYSLLDGATKVEDLVDKAIRLGMPAVAVTDHGNMFACKLLYDTAKNAGIKPILGCEAYVCRDHNVREKGYNHLVLLAKNLTGYHNLVRLISLGYLEGMYYKPRIDKALLEKYHEGLIVSSACIVGEIAKDFDDGHPEEAEKAALWYKNLFGDDFYLEIMLHKADYAGAPPDVLQLYERQRKVNDAILALGKKLDIKVIATNDVHFLDKEDAEAHDLLLCMSTQSDIDDPKRLRYTQQEWFKSYEEMRQVFPDNDEELRNTLEIAEKVEDLKLNSDAIMPVFPIPESFGSDADYEKYTEADLRKEFGDDRYNKLSGGKPDGVKVLRRIKFESDYLSHLTYEGAKKRWPEGMTDEAKERIAFELETIKTMGFPGYFLIVQDYILAARSLGISVGPGRGSAAGSAVAYCLTITNVDPIKYGLLFERFLNPDRISMPDIDVDFEDIGLPAVREWVTQKYGQDHVAHIVTFGTMAPKSCIKDIARVLKVPIPEANRLASLVPDVPKINWKKAVAESPDLKAEYDSPDPNVQTIMRLAGTLDGNVRQTGIHACGIIISRDPLIDSLPIMPSEEDSLMTTQYDGHFVEPIGLLKMDFLGLKTLTVLKECLQTIKEKRGIDVDIDHVDITDKETYALFARGETTGLFQFESDGMKKHLRALHPSCFADLVAMNALYRPGPMDYIPKFTACKLGQEPITYDHPLMEKYLKETYGVTVYQEQVMLLSRLLGGFTRGQSDTLRKAMGKKNFDLMANLKEKFTAGCHVNPEFMKEYGGDVAKADAVINKIWEDWTAFAKYAFNKSHAVCYAYVAYQTGYLKAHYPVEYMCAQISSEIGNFEKLPGFVAEAAEMGIAIRPPNVNESMTRFFPEGSEEDKTMSYGLGGIKGVGAQAADAIVAERKANGPYKGLIDFCERVDPSAVNRKVIENLVRSGAMDCFGMPRARLFAGVDLAMSRAASARKDKEQGQATMFDLMGFGDTPAAGAPAGGGDSEFPDVPEWLAREKFGYEKELLGMYLTGHPMARYRHLEGQFTTVGDLPRIFAELQTPDDRRDVRVLAWVGEVSQRRDKNGQPWAIIPIEDVQEGKSEGLMFAKDFAKFGTSLRPHDAMVLCGQLGHSFRDPTQMSFVVREAYPMEEVPKRFTSRVVLTAPETYVNEEMLNAVQAKIKSRPGTITVEFRIESDLGKTVCIELPEALHVEAEEEFFHEIAQIHGLRASAQLRKDVYFDPDNLKPRRRSAPRSA